VSMTIEDVASVCHEANAAYCRTLGDNSQPTWNNAEDWQAESAIAGVSALIADPSKTSEQMHELWCEHKRAEGWVYGPVKDADTRQHPCLVPYGALPESQRAKDRLFRSVALALLPMMEKHG
jgi:hypothetical protein